jgi:hypothetical protein
MTQWQPAISEVEKAAPRQDRAGELLRSVAGVVVHQPRLGDAEHQLARHPQSTVTSVTSGIGYSGGRGGLQIHGPALTQRVPTNVVTISTFT